jgi:hypothetical protein
MIILSIYWPTLKTELLFLKVVLSFMEPILTGLAKDGKEL